MLSVKIPEAGPAPKDPPPVHIPVYPVFFSMQFFRLSDNSTKEPSLLFTPSVFQ